MMKNGYRQLDLDEAVAGMVLFEDVIDGYGSVLLPRAATLTQAMLTSLRRRGVDTILVINDDDPVAKRERLQQRLARIFRKGHEGTADRILRKYVTEYRLGEME